MYINLAIVANALYLLTGDQDLLDLITTSTEVARQFRSPYPFLRIMRAGFFVKEIESRRSQADTAVT
jgi:predicted nucleic acid-binding protein